MRRTLFFSACLLACNEFPEELRPKTDAPSADGGAALDREAKLVRSDTGTHNALVATADAIAWSTTQGSTLGLRILACSLTGDCQTPVELKEDPCGTSQATFSGYLAAAGDRVFVTNTGCEGWLYSFVPSDGDPNSSIQKGYSDNVGFFRMAGDASGLVGTSRKNGSKEIVIAASDAAFGNNNTTRPRGNFEVTNLEQSGNASITTSPSHTFWFETVGDGSSFRVMASTRTLDPIDTPFEVVKARKGSPVALAATDAEVFVGYVDANKNNFVRVSIASSDEHVLAQPISGIGAAMIVETNVIWSEGASLRRTSLDGKGPLLTIGHTPGPTVTHIAATPHTSSIVLMTSLGIYRL